MIHPRANYYSHMHADIIHTNSATIKLLSEAGRQVEREGGSERWSGERWSCGLLLAFLGMVLLFSEWVMT